MGASDERLGVRAGEHDGSVLGCESVAASAATASARPGSCAGSGTMRSLPPAGGSSMPTPSRCAASRSESLIGRSASGVCASPCSRIAPRVRSGAVRSKAIITSAADDAVAGEQVPDEPRARQLARHVVLQVGVEPPVARVELGRRADGEDGGVEQVEPERLRDVREPVVGVRDGVAAAQLERAVVGDVEPAERVGRVRVVGRHPLDRRHHAAVDEVEADGRRTGRCHAAAQAIRSATESASRSIASPGCDTESGPLAEEPRCWTTWASSWAISLSPDDEPGLYSPLAK